MLSFFSLFILYGFSLSLSVPFFFLLDINSSPFLRIAFVTWSRISPLNNPLRIVGEWNIATTPKKKQWQRIVARDSRAFQLLPLNAVHRLEAIHQPSFLLTHSVRAAIFTKADQQKMWLDFPLHCPFSCSFSQFFFSLPRSLFLRFVSQKRWFHCFHSRIYFKLRE